MKAVLDSCVIYPTVMREVLLGVAEAGGYTPLWSPRIIEEWRRAVALISSATNEEMTDPEIPHEALLYRLFHEDGVRVTEPRALSFGCGCTERARAMLENMNKDQAADLVENGRIVVTCQFCNRTQVFDTEDLSAMGIEA